MKNKRTISSSFRRKKSSTVCSEWHCFGNDGFHLRNGGFATLKSV